MFREPSENEEEELINKVSKYIVKRGLVAPTLLFATTFRSLSSIGGQFGRLFVAPFIPIYEQEVYQVFQVFGKFGNVEKLLDRIELDDENERRKKDEKKKKSDSDGNIWLRFKSSFSRFFLGRGQKDEE